MKPQSEAHLISINIQLFLFCNKKNGRRNYEIMYLIMVVGFELDSNLDIDNSQCWLTYLSSVHDIQVIISAKSANEHAANFDSLGVLITFSIEWTGKKMNPENKLRKFQHLIFLERSLRTKNMNQDEKRTRWTQADTE